MRIKPMGGADGQRGERRAAGSVQPVRAAGGASPTLPTARQIQAGHSFQHGFSLLELMVAMLLLTMVSAMIYSILNVGIRFTEKGGESLVEMERKYGLLNLLHRQIRNAHYDEKKKQLLVKADGDVLKVVTHSPLIHQDVGLALALYRYDSSAKVVYYAEKRDYYNIDYGEDYLPGFDEMGQLAVNEEEFAASFDPETDTEVTVKVRGESYVFQPACQEQKTLATGGVAPTAPTPSAPQVPMAPGKP